jgi:hypothetical protein
MHNLIWVQSDQPMLHHWQQPCSARFLPQPCSDNGGPQQNPLRVLSTQLPVLRAPTYCKPNNLTDVHDHGLNCRLTHVTTQQSAVCHVSLPSISLDHCIHLAHSSIYYNFQHVTWPVIAFHFCQVPCASFSNQL